MKAIPFFVFFFSICTLYAQEGSLDPSFGQGGRLTIGFDGTTAAQDPTSVAVQSDGKIVVTGFGFHLPGVTTPHICVTRLLSNGTLDPTFSGDGKAGFVIDANAANNIPRVLRVLDNGKILIFVTAATKLYLFRLLATGEPDPSFGTNGAVKIFSTLEANAGFFTNHAMEVQSNGKIVVSYRIKYTGLNSAAQIISRFLSNGTPDNTFVGAGRFAVDSTSTISPLTGPIEQVQLALVSGNKILLVGDTILQASPVQVRIKLIRLNVDGTFDQSFGINGKLTLPNIQLQVNGLQVDASQNIFIAGLQGGTNAVVKIKPNGTLDAAYGTNGVATGGAINFVIINGGLVLSNGQTVLGGITSGVNPFQTGCKSFDSQGAINTSFGTAGISEIPKIGEENILRAITVQTDGKIILAGKRKAVSSVNVSDFEVIRLSAATTPVLNIFEKNDFQIWPNPTRDMLNVTFSGRQENLILSLLSLDGKLLKSIPAQEETQKFDLKNLPAGNYFLQAYVPGMVPVTKSVVKAN